MQHIAAKGAKRIGVMASLLLGAVSGSASHLALAYLAAHDDRGGAEFWTFVFAVSLDSFAYAFASIVLITYMSSPASAQLAADQYALLTSICALPGSLLAGVSGFFVERSGFEHFFVETSLIGPPVALLCWWIWRHRLGRKQERLCNRSERMNSMRWAARLLLLPLLILSFAPFAYSEERPSIFLEDLTWSELRDAIGTGKTTIIVPIGGTEQNGPAMALGKHNRRVKLLCERIAVALGNALVAPVIAYVPEGSISPPSGHMRFPGTITVPEAAFEAILESAARSFKLHGFKDIVFLGDHGGYQANEKTVANKLDREWASSKVRAHAITQYYDAAQIDFVRILRSQGFTLSEIGTHAGLSDTSLMLALDPSLVREDRLSNLSKFGSADGVYGDPTKASAKLGSLGVDAIVFQTVAAIKSAVSQR